MYAVRVDLSTQGDGGAPMTAGNDAPATRDDDASAAPGNDGAVIPLTLPCAARDYR